MAAQGDDIDVHRVPFPSLGLRDHVRGSNLTSDHIALLVHPNRGDRVRGEVDDECVAADGSGGGGARRYGRESGRATRTNEGPPLVAVPERLAVARTRSREVDRVG